MPKTDIVESYPDSTSAAPEQPPGLNCGERDAINLDYRLLALLLTSATRPDLLAHYLQGRANWRPLIELGFPERMLAEALYLFNNDETKSALARIQRVWQTLVDLNDYCRTSCPNNFVVRQIIACSAKLTRPLQRAGVEG